MAQTRRNRRKGTTKKGGAATTKKKITQRNVRKYMLAAQGITKPTLRKNRTLFGLKKANLENIIKKYNKKNISPIDYLEKMKKMLSRLGKQYENAQNSANNDRSFKVSQVILFISISVREFMKKNKDALKSQEDILADLLGAMNIGANGNNEMMGSNNRAGGLIGKLTTAYESEPQNYIELLEEFLDAFLDEYEDKQDSGESLDNWDMFATELMIIFSGALLDAQTTFKAQARNIVAAAPAAAAPTNANVDDLVAMFGRSTML